MCREGQIRGGVLKGALDLRLTRFLSLFFHTCPLPLAAPPLPFSEHPTRCPSRPARGPSSAKEKQPRERTLRAAAVAILKCCHYAQRGHLAGPHMAAGKIEVGGAVVTSPRRHAARFLVRLLVAASFPSTTPRLAGNQQAARQPAGSQAASQPTSQPRQRGRQPKRPAAAAARPS